MKLENKYLYSLLEDFSLNRKEVDIYIALLKNPRSSVLELAEITGIKRSTTHSYVENLKDKGLVSEIKIDMKRKLIAENPEKLELLISLKRFELNRIEQSINQVISALKQTRTIF